MAEIKSGVRSGPRHAHGTPWHPAAAQAMRGRTVDAWNNRVDSTPSRKVMPSLSVCYSLLAGLHIWFSRKSGMCDLARRVHH
jgi:hypothetical protein